MKFPPPLWVDAVSELLRVARCRGVMSIPCSQAAVAADARLLRWDSSREAKRAFWLREHVEYGLPDDVEMRTMIANSAKRLGKLATVATEDHMPVLVHDVIHCVLIVANYRFARLASLGLWLVLPLLWAFAGRERYRRFFVVDLVPLAEIGADGVVSPNGC